MDESQANKAVFIAAAVLIAAAFLENHFNPTKFDLYKRLWGIGALSLVLAMTADFVPEVAGPLALLILTAVAVHDSQYFGQALDLGNKKETKKASKK